MSANQVKGDFSVLTSFIHGMSENWIGKVGIMGSKASRKGDAGTNNAEIGAVHEFGSPSRHIPQRSFLRMPIETHQNVILNLVAGHIKSNMLSSNKALLAQMQKAVVRQIGIACEIVIQQAFGNRGFGEWPPNSPQRAAYKLTSRRKKATPENVAKDHPLIDTGQLRRSITSKVEAA